MNSKSLSHMKWKCQYHIYTQIPKKEIVRTDEARCTGDIKYIMQVQRCRNNRRSGVSIMYICV